MEIYGDGTVIKAEPGKNRKNCRHWYLQVETSEGRKRRRFTGTFTQAKAALGPFKTELLTPHTNMRFVELGDKWTTFREKTQTVHKNTIDKDRQQIRRLCTKFGNMKIADMTESVIVDGIASLRDDEGLSSSYVKGLYTRLNQIMKFAKRQGWIADNPMEYLSAPKVPKSKRTSIGNEAFGKFLTLLEFYELDSHTIGARIAVLAGLRRGEVVGLNWGDVDFTTNMLYVNRSCDEKRILNETKSDAGTRRVPMLKVLHTALAEWQRKQEFELKQIGIKQTLDTPVITSKTGTRMHPQNLNRWWRNIRDDFGLQGVVLHELRHTLLTMLGNQKASLETLKSIAGWSDIAMANTYVHTEDAANIEAMAELDRYLEGII